MSWTEITRQQYRRDGLRYASDTTDAEWKLIEPFMPAPCRRGRPREVNLRVIMNAILYIAATGCQWRALPKDFPPCSTVRYYFYKWRGSGLWSLDAGWSSEPSPGSVATVGSPKTSRDRSPARKHGS